MTKFIKRTVDIVFIALLNIIILAMGVSLAEIAFGGVTAFVIGCVITVATIVSCLLVKTKAICFFTKLLEYFENIPVWKLALILGLFSVITKVAFVFLFNNNADLHPDMAMYRSFAEQYAKAGTISEHGGYALKFRYTAIYGLVLSPIVKLFGADTKAFTVVLSVFHSASMVMLFDIFRKYAGKAVSFIVLMIYCILPFGLFQTQLLTHENGLLVFHILALWIFLKAFDTKTHPTLQFVYILFSAFIISVGKSINAAGRVFVVSFCIFAVAKLFENGFSFKRLIKALCLILVFVMFYFGAATISGRIVTSTVEDVSSYKSNSKTLSYGWPLYLGFNYEHSGKWNREDADTYNKYAEFEDRDEALQYQEELVKGRLQQYVEAPYKLPIHFFNKIKVLWGTQTLPFAYEQGNKINDFVLKGAGGVLNKGFILIDGIAFLVLYSVILINKIKGFKKKNDFSITPSLHFEMAIIGFTLALLLFEVTPKYASHTHILFFGILALNIKNFFSRKEERIDQNSKKEL